MFALQERTPLYVPVLHRFEREGIHYLVDLEAPNWIAVEPRGAALVDWIAGAPAAGPPPCFGELVARYAAHYSSDSGKAWLHAHDFLRSLDRAGMLSDRPFERPPYPGRWELVRPEGLRELWIQVNNACNLACTHCLVSSGPGGLPGPDPETLRRILEGAAALGMERLYLTGGEPLLRRDLFGLVDLAARARGAEVIILTNATILAGPVLEGLKSLDRGLVKFQVSVDGARPETNDPVRGPGTFEKALAGARRIADLGFEVSLTTVVTEQNLVELPRLPEIARDAGAKSQHLMWSHRRGRAALGRNGFFPPCGAILPALMETADACRSAGITLDNLESVRLRVNGVPGVKYDLGNAGWDSLCVYADGKVYPSAALAGETSLVCGDAAREGLEEILATSPVIEGLRRATLARKPSVAADPFRFLTGGGDIEHAWCFSGGDFLGADPYYPLAVALAERVMVELAEEKRARKNLRSGYDAPLLLHAMGEGAIACGTADGSLAEQPVLTLHSNCVLSFDVDKPRARVREFYADAAENPQPELCCPSSYDAEAVSHIPQEVLDRFYGCGSPMASAGVRAGETVLDLGSGAGIDVFIAARLVGPAGRAIGVDMTERMLEVARESRPKVASALGYDVVEIREGFLERIPAESRSVDLVTSNCVINLSPDKPRVFEEIWRVLKDHGRAVISDIVSDREVPPRLKTNPRLWGECLVGALTEEAFLVGLERAGFYGLEVLKRSFWKNVEGAPFFSVTVRGYKFEKTSGCVFRGQRAVYLGPGKAFLDEEGHRFARNEPLEVCTDTAAKLAHPPYAGFFAVLEPGEDRAGYACRNADGTPCGPGCC
jgi:MoaA/NifB/PqqE/SkfB family radical SAM enzyme/SAM-dependent methyltransferase